MEVEIGVRSFSTRGKGKRVWAFQGIQKHKSPFIAPTRRATWYEPEAEEVKLLGFCQLLRALQEYLILAEPEQVPSSRQRQ